MGGDDILDLGAVLCLLQCQGIDQDGFVGNGGGDALEFGQIAVRLGRLLQDGTCFKAFELLKRQ